MLVVYLIIEYPTLEFLVPKAILPSAIQKNGSTPPSKSPAPNMGEHLNQPTESPTTSSDITMTPSLPPAKHNEYLCATQ
jgi:hypothetical protein